MPSRPIDKGALNKILLNPYYMGTVRFDGKHYKGKHQPLTDEATWQKVQEILASHICGERTREHPHFLKSTVYCGSCGERLIVQYAKSHTGVRYPYFSCAGRHNKRNDCKQKSLLIDEVEREIERLYENIEFGPKFRKELETWVLAEIDKTMRDFEQERQELEREKDKLERKQKKLLETYYADAIPLDLFKEEQDGIKSAVSSIDKRLDAHNTECADVRKRLGQALDLVEDCGKTYKAAPDSIKRAYNRALFDKILVFPNGETVPEFAEPYTVLFEQTTATDNADNTGDSVTEDGTAGGPIAKVFEKIRNHEPSNFFGRGFSKRLLVGTTGFEPVTSWL
ncbi:MAG: recombinase family protein [Clostridiales Family XIII bacterium]|nr:recombinase family protein [Clostridiales Family XIII bacterium]